LRIQFCGADRTVTGSSHLLEINGLRLFLDMGLFQGQRDLARQINSRFPADVKSADCIVLSHGHLDHCGKLPAATKAGFKGPIYCTPATAEVARIVLEDSARLQVEDSQYLNHRARPANQQVKPLYGPEDVPGVTKLFKFVEYGASTDIGQGVKLTFLDAGHILGSAYVVLEWNEGGASEGGATEGGATGGGTSSGVARSLLFTADVGRYGAPILRDPAPLPRAFDIVITESTYGGVSHGPMADVEPQILDAVQQTIARKSRLICPSFAIGRTQTMLWYFQKFISEKKIPAIPVFVDSPMGVAATEATEKFPQLYDQETKALLDCCGLFRQPNVHLASSSDDSKRINDQRGPVVIIASSPTCEFGRVLHHLTQSVEQPNDTVLFCGWVPPETLGRRLQNGEKRVRIFDRWYDVRCVVKTIHGLSAHADGDELLKFLGPTLKPQTTAYVVHGEVDQAEKFAARLRGAGVGRANIPAMESSMVDDAQSGGDQPPNKTSAAVKDEGE
jgi:metallo-beta-lactamase family protein